MEKMGFIDLKAVNAAREVVALTMAEMRNMNLRKANTERRNDIVRMPDDDPDAQAVTAAIRADVKTETELSRPRTLNEFRVRFANAAQACDRWAARQPDPDARIALALLGQVVENRTDKRARFQKERVLSMTLAFHFMTDGDLIPSQGVATVEERLIKDALGRRVTRWQARRAARILKDRDRVSPRKYRDYQEETATLA